MDDFIKTITPDEYRVIIDSLAKSNSDIIFPNSGPIHAAIVMAKIFEKSKEVCIYSGAFSKALTCQPEYYNALEKFLNSNKKLYLMLSKYNNENDNKAYDLIQNKTNVKISLATDGFINELKTMKKDNFHFAIGDDNIFRIEINPAEYKALFSFNNRDIVSKYKTLFNKYFNFN